MNSRTNDTKRFYRDEKSWHKNPFVFIDSGRPIPNEPALLRRRDYLHRQEAVKVWESLRAEGWISVQPQWGADAEKSL
ncbi:DUF1651 domain-containing protein [Prochlorococcus sp. MIT 1307]|uniref:DUF1651 domain-containing protein n=1 Tax=Prochlorococcus sp. MIT 1307 TaxID=3096219 RepID=UPI002A74D8A1|nr:DUF1651 domain-containing protein [Prochlorococcus sp. MIT 1307]